ncbi:MAG: hypothetical protein ABI091_08865 [Ferruginibacter sp.]
MDKIKLEELFVNFNYALIFMGVAISFTSLQDTKKTQNKFSRKVWEDPRKGKIALIIMTIMTFLFIAMGMVGIYTVNMSVLKEISFGLIVMGIGLLGVLKSAIEMFENHRLDKNPRIHKQVGLKD